MLGHAGRDPRVSELEQQRTRACAEKQHRFAVERPGGRIRPEHPRVAAPRIHGRTIAGQGGRHDWDAGERISTPVEGLLRDSYRSLKEAVSDPRGGGR